MHLLKDLRGGERELLASVLIQIGLSLIWVVVITIDNQKKKKN